MLLLYNLVHRNFLFSCTIENELIEALEKLTQMENYEKSRYTNCFTNYYSPNIFLQKVLQILFSKSVWAQKLPVILFFFLLN